MKKFLFGILILAFEIVVPIPTMAGVDVNVSIALPPPFIFSAPPEMIVLPETYVYVVPDVDMDIFFFNGWWWRPWEGRWYRSRDYNAGWVYYQKVPSFYRRIPSSWRNDYRNHRWRGHQWNYQRIPHQQVQQNWRGWEKTRHWEKQQTWGVQGLKPRTRAQQPSQAVQPGSQAKPRSREAVKPQLSQPQSGRVPQQQSSAQHREKQKKSKPQQEKPEQGQEEKHERK